MAKRIRGLSRERLKHTRNYTTVCFCKEAEDGEHECPAFDFLQAQKLTPAYRRFIADEARYLGDRTSIDHLRAELENSI